jgi:hypothetical protein
MVLSLDGLLFPFADSSGSEALSWSPLSCSMDPMHSPRSVMDMFQVSLAPISRMGPLATVDDWLPSAELNLPPTQDFASFRESYRWPVLPVLPRPVARR